MTGRRSAPGDSTPTLGKHAVDDGPGLPAQARLEYEVAGPFEDDVDGRLRHGRILGLPIRFAVGRGLWGLRAQVSSNPSSCLRLGT